MKVRFGLSKKRREYLIEGLKKLQKKFPLYDPLKVILFGSLVREELHKGSDLDLIIIKEEIPSHFLDRLEMAYSILDPDIPVDILVYTPEEIEKMKISNPFIKRALQEGIIIYERKPSRNS
ncbi:MAG: nucleotidyltransferase domain-containing protein [Thermodesulfobacteriaceae bacterium]|nr:nucleotidyltransferase domain-containing protein [Thermodesulfobacteriaceae bacterium]MCX8041408.1 nucleotidyltransferase domain-containing protein [Thermodesulfobacteriaceae bacterium]MDW8135826.1 nucleotidyltransferase domain-containing protein [Thermodesulfobacterium sp.]